MRDKIDVILINGGFATSGFSWHRDVTPGRFYNWLRKHKIQFAMPTIVEKELGHDVERVRFEFNDEKALKWITHYNSGNGFCPFCGGIPDVKHRTECGGHGEFYKTAQVVCTECGASTRSVIIDGFYGAETTEQDAIDAWNMRC